MFKTTYLNFPFYVQSGSKEQNAEERWGTQLQFYLYGDCGQVIQTSGTSAHPENGELDQMLLKFLFVLKKKDSNCNLLKYKGKSVLNYLEAGSPMLVLLRSAAGMCAEEPPVPFSEGWSL